MKVLIVFAHPNSKSFCHAVLRQFTAGLRSGGHTADIADLYREKFDPVFRFEDMTFFLDLESAQWTVTDSVGS